MDEPRRTWVVIIEGQVDIEGEYTLGMPPGWSFDDLISPDSTVSGTAIEDFDGTVGRGVAAQAYFIAQELESFLSAEELEDLKQRLGVETDITGTDLTNAFKSGIMSWGEIKKLTGNPGSNDGNLGTIVSSGNENKPNENKPEEAGKPDKEDKPDKGNSGGKKK